MSEEIKEIIYDIKNSINETPKKMYKYNQITFNLNELSEIFKYIEQLENIRKKAIEFTNSHFKEMVADEEAQALLNILNKGSESNV